MAVVVAVAVAGAAAVSSVRRSPFFDAESIGLPGWFDDVSLSPLSLVYMSGVVAVVAVMVMVVAVVVAAIVVKLGEFTFLRLCAVTFYFIFAVCCTLLAWGCKSCARSNYTQSHEWMGEHLKTSDILSALFCAIDAGPFISLGLFLH